VTITITIIKSVIPYKSWWEYCGECHWIFWRKSANQPVNNQSS